MPSQKVRAQKGKSKSKTMKRSLLEYHPDTSYSQLRPRSLHLRSVPKFRHPLAHQHQKKLHSTRDPLSRSELIKKTRSPASKPGFISVIQHLPLPFDDVDFSFQNPLER